MGNSIEEDIAKVNTYIELVLEKDYCNCNELNTILGKHCDGSKNVAYAMQHILSDYKRVLKENEELKEDRDKFKKALGKRITYCNELEKDLFENCSNYVISKQKVKDKIEELNQYYKKEIYPSLYQWGDITITEHYDEMIALLQELIKESEE